VGASADTGTGGLYFVPAESPAEAITRIFSLTGRAPDRTRGEKRALIALRDALSLDVDVVELGSTMAAKIADALGVDWNEQRHVLRSTVTLEGLNALLLGATLAYQRGALAQLRDDQPAALDGPEWDMFRPAQRKIEAVTRIAALTGAPPETLGPGGKERKSVFLNLARALFPDLHTDGLTKTTLGEALATRLHVPWTASCYSTQQTIQLEGLNTILAGAERHLGRLGSSAADALGTPEAEGSALVAALQSGFDGTTWWGRTAVEWMRTNDIRGFNDNEWQGFYFEGRARRILGAFPPPTAPCRVKYGTTVFDYSLNHVWDLKTHVEEQLHPISHRVRRAGGALILNDEQAIRDCVQEQGLGFLVMSGTGVMDEDGAFVSWHREFKGRASARSNSGTSRLRKAAFEPLRIDGYWLASTAALQAAITGGQLLLKPQGRQAPRHLGQPGAPRPNKFQMRPQSARRSSLLVSTGSWGSSSAHL
jgi:hypothetical protein